MLKIQYYTFLFFLILVSCNSKTEIVEEPYLPKDSREAYLIKLENSGILETALGERWLLTGKESLENPLQIKAPFAEDFFVDENDVKAHGYRFEALRGQKISVFLKSDEVAECEIFIDAFRVINDSLHQYVHVASMEEETRVLEFEPRADGEYILRFQTELLRGGFFRIEIQQVPALAFPVVGKDKSAIGSLFGAPRDGGKRKHHGVDIFAKRHTPIIAPTEGRIRFVGERGLGGRVIWMRDTKRNQTLYFAHLHDILVEDDAYVYPGDTLGTVGNTGNARTTPPHLHFGIYKDGPIDPYNFIADTRTTFRRELAKKELVGKLARAQYKTHLKLSGISSDAQKETIPRGQIMEVLGRSANYYRVRLPENITGYISHNSIESAVQPIREIYAVENENLFSNPSQSAFKIEEVDEGESLEVYGTSNGFQMVKNNKGTLGWMRSIGG